jgi:hypothetical protein
VGRTAPVSTALRTSATANRRSSPGPGPYWCANGKALLIM